MARGPGGGERPGAEAADAGAGAAGRRRLAVVRGGATRYREHLDAQDARREERIAEIGRELEEAIRDDEVEDALSSAIELQLLTNDERAVLDRPEVSRDQRGAEHRA